MRAGCVATICARAARPARARGRSGRGSRRNRRRSTCSMSRIAAPVGEVMTPIRRGRRGSGRLRSRANSPSAASLRLQLLELAVQRAYAGVLHVIDDELVVAARLVQADPAPHQHVHAVPRGEARQQVSLPEHGAAHLGGVVLEREIPVAGAGAGKVGDFALQPQRWRNRAPAAIAASRFSRAACRCRAVSWPAEAARGEAMNMSQGSRLRQRHARPQMIDRVYRSVAGAPRTMARFHR